MPIKKGKDIRFFYNCKCCFRDSVYFLSCLYGEFVVEWEITFETTDIENVMEYIGAISAIKVFSGEEKKTGKVLQSMYDYIASAKKAIYVQSVPMSFITLLMEGGIVMVAIFGSIILSNQPITGWNIIIYILSIILAGQFSKNFSKYNSGEMSDSMLYLICLRTSCNSGLK